MVVTSWISRFDRRRQQQDAQLPSGLYICKYMPHNVIFNRAPRLFDSGPDNKKGPCLRRGLGVQVLLSYRSVTADR